MTKILGLGHSHIVAIAKGCYELQNEGFQLGGAPLDCRFLYLYDPELTPTLAEESAAARLNPRLRKIIEEEEADGIVLSVGGNEHIALSVTQPNERFDFILGAEPELDLEPGAAVLTEAAVRETLREKMTPTLCNHRSDPEGNRRAHRLHRAAAALAEFARRAMSAGVFPQIIRSAQTFGRRLSL